MASDYSLFNTILIWVYWGLLVCIPLFVFLGVVQLLVAIIQWRSEKRIGRLKRAGVFFVLAALMPVAIFGLWRGILRPSMAAELMARSQKRIADASVLQVGTQVNDFHNKLASLGFPSDRPKITVLNFFATWCGPCLTELPHLQRVADRFAGEKDVVFVVVGREESQETLDEFASKNGYRMPFVADKEGSLYREFAKTIIPRTYVIDQTGTIQFEIIGFDQEKLTELHAKIIELVDELTEENFEEPAKKVVQLNVGDRFPSIKSATLDGMQVTVGPELYGKKATLVVFWSTWCKFCLIDLPHEVELANRYESSGLRVLGVNADDDLETAKRAVVDQSIPWLNLYEGKQKSISNQLAITSWPALFLLDSNGTIVATTDMLRRTCLATMPDGSVQSVYKLDTYSKNLLEANDR